MQDGGPGGQLNFFLSSYLWLSLKFIYMLYSNGTESYLKTTADFYIIQIRKDST